MRTLKPRRPESEPPYDGGPSPARDTDLPEDVRDELVAVGLAVGEPMGRDRPGHLAPRRALDDAGNDVVVQVVDVPEGAGGARALRRLADLRLVRNGAIAPVRQVVSLPKGRVAVVSELIVGADLAVVLGARGGLTRDEAARLLDDLGGALAHLHGSIVDQREIGTHYVFFVQLNEIRNTNTQAPALLYFRRQFKYLA